jgi:hypothetical protein
MMGYIGRDISFLYGFPCLPFIQFDPVNSLIVVGHAFGVLAVMGYEQVYPAGNFIQNLLWNFHRNPGSASFDYSHGFAVMSILLFKCPINVLK